MAYAPANTLPHEHSNWDGPPTRAEAPANVLVPSIRPIRDSMSDP